MSTTNPRHLLLVLVAYYAGVILVFNLLVAFLPGASQWLPVDGNQLQFSQLHDGAAGAAVDPPLSRAQLTFGLVAYLVGTLVLMLPLTWVYMTINRESRSPTFVMALMVLPICVASIVLLIQDSLPLAFGLVALVAAIRFQLPLGDVLDGIFVFAAICVALASGVGYIGIALVTSAFFGITSLLIHATGYGASPGTSRAGNAGEGTEKHNDIDGARMPS